MPCAVLPDVGTAHTMTSTFDAFDESTVRFAVWFATIGNRFWEKMGAIWYMGCVARAGLVTFANRNYVLLRCCSFFLSSSAVPGVGT
jgi:hypothetical protein